MRVMPVQEQGWGFRIEKIPLAEPEQAVAEVPGTRVVSGVKATGVIRSARTERIGGRLARGGSPAAPAR